MEVLLIEDVPNAEALADCLKGWLAGNPTGLDVAIGEDQFEGLLTGRLSGRPLSRTFDRAKVGLKVPTMLASSVRVPGS